MLMAGVLLLPERDAIAQIVRIKRDPITPRTRIKTTPDTTYQIYTGLRVVGKGMAVSLCADTTGSGTTTVTSYAWTFVSKPSGSVAAFNNASASAVKFTADLLGQYIIQVAVNGGAATHNDTILASTYRGQALTGGNCYVCHSGTPTSPFETWKISPHATIFSRGISGQLEVELNGKGAYATSCVKCHTTGWEPYSDNGNFGYLAKQSGWDTTWYKTLTYSAGDYWINYKDSTLLKNLPSNMVSTANIGCESCHGPGLDHMATADKKKIGKSKEAGVCLQCHDAPNKHRLGSYWSASKHGIFAEGSHTARTSCFPCHSGSAFVKYVNNKVNPGYDTTTVQGQPSATSDGNININCVSCHDPHGNTNPAQLRTIVLDSLRNGYIPPSPSAGVSAGRVCMTCHSARYSVKARVTTKGPYYGFAERFGPHENPQADIFFGSNGYQYGDNRLTGLQSHGGLSNECATCHMATRINGSSVQSNHELAMEDTTGGLHDATWAVDACKQCHGPNITKFDDIKAYYDYDGDGTIEGVQSEVQGLLDRLKAILPKNATTGEPTTTMADSLLVKNKPEVVQGIWNYYLVKNDKSLGVHNPKYAVSLLQKSLGMYPVASGVEVVGRAPTLFSLENNYPNPFNPSTRIEFSIPRESSVRLIIFDIIGRVVATLVDTRMAPGTYKVTWDGRNEVGQMLSSGVYLYRLQADDRVSTKKMLLMK